MNQLVRTAVAVAAGSAFVALILLQRPPVRGPEAQAAPAVTARNDEVDEDAVAEPRDERSPGTAWPDDLSPVEKAARVEKISRDYGEIRAKTAAEYSSDATRFPGGLSAFLRQLALIEREKRADLAAVLSPRELEDLEMRETLAGQQVQRWLGDTAATEAQRRAVFRLQREFDERFSVQFDVTPAALLERETARHALQEEVRRVLGDALFASWLRGEGPDYGGFVSFAARQGLPDKAPLELWRAKNEFIRRRLEIAAQPLPAQHLPAAQTALARDIEARVLAIVGPAALVSARAEILNWLPLR